MQSIWQETKMPQFPRLEGNLNTDVLIIGGGIAGLLTAYYLQQSGVECVVAEKNRICSGNTGFTTAKITAQHGLVYQKIAAGFGLEAARRYYEVNQLAVEEYARLSEGIDCDFIRMENFVYSTQNRKKLEAEMEILSRIQARATLVNAVPLPVATVGAVCFAGQAQFDPLKFLSGIAENLHILENTFVRELVGTDARTDTGTIHARRIVCATHFPMINKHGSFFLKLYQHRSYVIALENAQKLDGMYVDEADSGLSFRNAHGKLLLGGGGGHTGSPCGAWEELRQFANVHYPEARETGHWAAQDCMSLDGMPYVGQYSARTRDFYVAAGFNKWGMTGAMAAAWILRDQLLGRKNEYGELLSPSRSILRRQLWVNGIHAAGNLLKPTRPRCPHMGCALVWNPAEHSWDCPCHGSRFAKDGRLLENPANGDLR